ncbi:MAG: FtsQ-type POTRA domain-containing protein [Nitrospirota bacterium]|nr:FtsQ-type POTRA domain-containing protein [Nitrospirota bacterium]
MGVRDILSSKQPRKNRPLKRGDGVRRSEKIRKTSPIRRVVMGSLLAGLIVGVVIGGRTAIRSVNAWTKIQQVTIVGLERLSREEITAELNLPSDSSLWSIDMDQLKGQLEAHPWIRSVTFDRVLPHSLIVQVEERQPAALLRAAKATYFLDGEGHLLPGETTKAGEALPVLEGMTSKFFTQHQDESHRRAKQGIHLAELLSERFPGRPTVNVAHPHTTIVDLPRFRFQFGQEVDQQWERFLVLYPTVKDAIERQSQEVDLRFSQKVILRKRTL